MPAKNDKRVQTAWEYADKQIVEANTRLREARGRGDEKAIVIATDIVDQWLDWRFEHKPEDMMDATELDYAP